MLRIYFGSQNRNQCETCPILIILFCTISYSFLTPKFWVLFVIQKSIIWYHLQRCFSSFLCYKQLIYLPTCFVGETELRKWVLKRRDANFQLQNILEVADSQLLSVCCGYIRDWWGLFLSAIHPLTVPLACILI